MDHPPPTAPPLVPASPEGDATTPPTEPGVPQHRPSPSPSMPGLQRVQTIQTVCIRKNPKPTPSSVLGRQRSSLPRRPTSSGFRRTPSGKLTPAAHPDIGREFGSYQVLEVLGEGAMGLVYLAEHVRLNRKVAIKRLKDRLAAKPEAVAQFFVEARAVNRINHPHIVDITDFVTGDGVAYYLMEHLEGETLAAALKRETPLNPSRVLYIVRQVAAALDAAHAAGFAHLDVKPSNIFLITKDGRSDYVKLLDFGIARLLERTPTTKDAPQSEPHNLGTPVYMSPEQASGELADRRSDIYSFGAVIYEMLTGRPPFEALSTTEYIYKHLSVQPTRITQLKGLPHRIPRGAARVVMRCLEKEPDDRPQTCAALVEALDKSVTLTGFEGTPHQGVAAIAASRRRSWVPAAVGAALVALAGVGWAVFGRDGRPAQELGLKGIAQAELATAVELRRNRAPLQTSVLLVVKTRPPMAEVSLLGARGRVLGLTPLWYRTQRTTDTWRLKVRLAGHKERTIEVVLDQNRSVELSLARQQVPPPDPAVSPNVEQRSARDQTERRSRRRKPGRNQSRKYDSVNTVNPFR